MKRVDPNNRAQADKFGSGKPGFQGGNPAAGVLPTIPGADWFNHTQEEICNVIEKSGMKLNSGEYDQLYKAIKKIFGTAVANNLTSDDTDKALSAAMGKKLNEEKVGKEGSQEINGATLTLGGQTYTGYRLWSSGGNEGLIIESNGSSSGHKIMVRKHNRGVFESGNIRSFALPAIDGDYTLAPAGLLSSVDLDTVTVPGLYGQNSNSNAQTSRHYPVAKAGSLLVMPSAYGVQQIYSVFDGTDIFARNQTGSGWGAWAKTNVSPAEMAAAIAAIEPNKSDAINLDDSNKLATSKAVKIVNDKVDRAAPAGQIAFFAGRNAPLGWLKANGAAVSRTSYPALFSAIGTTYGAGDGRNTFNLPDLRGEFLRGLDDGRNVDSGRVLGSNQGDAIRNLTGKLDSGTSSANQLIDYVQATGVFRALSEYTKQWTGDPNQTGNAPSAIDFDASRVVPVAHENRPRNIALMACIKI